MSEEEARANSERHRVPERERWSAKSFPQNKLSISLTFDFVSNINFNYDNSEAKFQRIIDHIRKKANDPDLELPRGETGKILVPKSYWDDPYYEIDRIVHQGWQIVRIGPNSCIMA